MRIAVVGAGAMGSMFGALLHRAGHDVTLVDVDDAQVDAINRHGLLLRSPDEEMTVALRATAHPSKDLDAVDAAIVLCKGWANENAARSIEHALRPASPVVTIQNGLGTDVTLAAVLGPDRIVSGTTTAGAHRPAPGIVDVSPITSAGGSITQLGRPRSDVAISETTNELARSLDSAGLPCSILTDANIVIWTKLAMAATAGPLTAAMGATVEEMVSSPSAMALFRSLFDEIVELAGTLGIALDSREVWDHALATYRAVGPHTTSMADDFASHRRSEIDSFCVEISRLGRAHGVATPTHDVIGQLLVAREEQGGLR